MIDMDIFIGNLPGEKYEPEILHLLRNIDKNARAHIKQTIHKHQHKGYFCVANIDQEKKARRFIKKFNQKSPYGHQLLIREFFHRSYGNERRDINWREKEWQGPDKRTGDRRTFVAQSKI